MIDSTVAMELKQQDGRTCLKFTFAQKLKKDEAHRMIAKWRQAFAARPGQRIVLIWDARELTGYESGARTAWQEALQEMKLQIDTIWLISKSSMISMGASVMAVFSSLDIKVVSTESEILCD